MLSLTSKNRLSNSTVKQIKAGFPCDISGLLDKSNRLELGKSQDRTHYVIRNGVPVFYNRPRCPSSARSSETHSGAPRVCQIREKDGYIPTLKCVHMLPGIVPRVVVDTGAIKHLINGADVMAPGLLHKTSEYPPVERGDIVAIYGHDKTCALAIGEVLMNNREVEEARVGVAIRTLHRLGDHLWAFREE